MRKKSKKFAAVLAASALGVVVAVPAASAAPPEGSPAYKSCGTEPTGRDHFTQEQFQTANCDSQGTGNEDTGGVTNNGGNQPPGQNK